jgi:protein-tyrosine-phosphatase
LLLVKDLPLKVLFLCTGNSARSQIAEAMLEAKHDARLKGGSAGTAPAPRVNPFALEELERRGISWSHARPKTVDAVMNERWDIVITVCDNARESCPVFPGQPVTAHWGVADPAAVEGDDDTKRRAFRDAAILLARRLDLLVALPLERLEALALSKKLGEIGELGTEN